jgi:aerobic carbon-monoxide dehydrogenase large subunit
MSLIGRSVTRLEDRPLLTGIGRFAADITPPDALYMRVVPSPVAFGWLTGLRIADALAHPGTVAIWTMEDVVDIPPIGFRMTLVPGLDAYRQPVLANGHVGEPVAAVFAADPYSAEDIAELVAPEIEPLTLCVDPAASPSEFAPGRNTEAAVIIKAYGDLDAAFARAHAVVTLELSVGRHSGVPLETRGAIAVPEAGSGILRLYGAAKVPHYNRQALAAMLGLPLDRIHLHEGHVGGGFGIRPEDVLTCAAALRLGRPVKLDRGPLRAFGSSEPVARLGPSGTRGGRRARLHSGARRRILVRPRRLPPDTRRRCRRAHLRDAARPLQDSRIAFGRPCAPDQ